jgi:uncharacterized repeat protein (TIGR03803 family)
MAAAGEQKVPERIRKSVLGFTGLHGLALPVHCESVPEPVRAALERNAEQMNAAQGYPANTPCEMPPPETIHDNVTGAVTLLASFSGNSGSTPGSSPEYGNLIQASDGNFYGTTFFGGNGYGTAFKITSAGVYMVLHNFSTAAADGENPLGSLIEGTDGNFYGTTKNGGALGYGTVFKLTSSGTVSLLHSFVMTDGSNPYAGVIEGTDGHLYGTTEAGR